MQKYTPKALPFSQRIAKSPGVRAFLVVLIVAFSIIYIQNSRKNSAEDSETFSTYEAEKSAPDFQLPPGQKPAPQTRLAQESVKPATTEGTLTRQQPTGGFAPATAVSNWQVMFLEVPRNAYEEHFGPFESFSESSLHGGIVNNADELIKNLKGIRELFKENKSLQKEETWEIFKGLRNYQGDEQDFGLNLNIQFSDQAEGQNVVQVNYLSQMPVYADRKIASIEPTSFGESVKIPPKGALFLTGGMPHKAGGEEYPLTGGPFEILTSPRFRESESEFVILLISK